MTWLYTDTTNHVVLGILSEKFEWIEYIEIFNQKSTADLHFLINEILQKHKLNFAKLDGYLFAAGPGSYTGMRVSEIIALKRDCLDLARGIITIRRSWSKITKKFQDTTKSGHKRVIGINPGLVLELERYLKTHDSEYVFNHSTFGHYTYSMIFGQFKRDQKSANVRSIGIHTIRHTFASHFVMRGGSIYDLKAVMGHSSIETTMRYAHLSPKYLRDQAELVSLEKLDQSNVIKLKMTE